MEVVVAKDKAKSVSWSCSQDSMGVSGEPLFSRDSSLVGWRVEIFLFFEEDVLTVSCLGSSGRFTMSMQRDAGISADAASRRERTVWWMYMYRSCSGDVDVYVAVDADVFVRRKRQRGRGSEGE